MKMIKRLEMMGGKRPDYTRSSSRWKAGKIREVLLSPTYPCARPERLGPEGDGGWVSLGVCSPCCMNAVFCVRCLTGRSFFVTAVAM